jgi:hypothetical protein
MGEIGRPLERASRKHSTIGGILDVHLCPFLALQHCSNELPGIVVIGSCRKISSILPDGFHEGYSRIFAGQKRETDAGARYGPFLWFVRPKRGPSSDLTAPELLVGGVDLLHTPLG